MHRPAGGVIWLVSATVILLAVFAAMVTFFRLADVYHTRFFDIPQPLALSYNAARLTLGLMIFWSCLGLGGVVTQGLGIQAAGEKAEALDAGAHQTECITGLDRVILDFFVGGTLLGCFWYTLGLLSLLRWPLAVGVHASVLLITAPRFGRLLCRAWAWIAAGPRLREALRGGTYAAAGTLLLWALLLLAATVMLADFAINALVPGGTTDVFLHYFPYLAQVLTSGTTLPAEGSNLWYHFYYTKTEGLFFAAGLLSDPLAPQIVSGVFLAVAGLCVYALLCAPLLPRHLALAGLIAFHSAFLTNADFVFHQKDHIVMLGNLAGLLWLCSRLWQKAPGFVGEGWRMLTVCAMLGAGCILNAPSAFAVTLPLCAGLTLFAFFVRSRRKAAPGLALLTAGLCCGLGITFILNYSFTGMAEINPFRLFWSHVDLERFSRWVSPYMMVLLDQGSGDAGKLTGPDIKALFKFRNYAALFKFAQITGLFQLHVLATAALVGALGLRPANAGLSATLRRFGEIALPCLLFAAAILTVGLVTRQGVSYQRFTGFALLPTTVLTLLFWQLLLCGPLQHPRRGALLAGCFALVLAANCLATVPQRLSQADRDAAQAFLIGQYSIGQQYTRLGALWPPATEIREITGNARVRLLHVASSTESMAPYAPLETDISFSLRGKWHVAMFAPADQARACLEEQQLNYFLLDMTKPFFDLLIYSPLFAPESLARNFRVIWRKGDAFLLTWADRTPEKPLSADSRELLQRWDDCMAYSEKNWALRGLYERVRSIYEFNNKSTTNIRIPERMPSVRGWQG
jgi:hypothetical protein